MTFTWSQVYPKDVTLLRNVWLKDPGSINYTVPNIQSYQWLVVSVLGCGGMGENSGGGGALAKSKVSISPGEVLRTQVGNVSTASVLGDSFVKRSNNVVIAYADRGRGNGQGGLASNSTGDLKRDGVSTIGTSGHDLTDVLSMGIGGVGYYYASNVDRAADPGGGGYLLPQYNSDHNWNGYYSAVGAGTGLVLLQFYDKDPGNLAW